MGGEEEGRIVGVDRGRGDGEWKGRVVRKTF